MSQKEAVKKTNSKRLKNVAFEIRDNFKKYLQVALEATNVH